MSNLPPLHKKTYPNEEVTILTKREYFAAQALIGLLNGFVDGESEGNNKAKMAVEFADDLIKRLNEK